MVFVGLFEAHELNLSLSLRGRGNRFCRAGWWTGQSACLGAEIGSSRRPLVGRIVGGVRLLLGLLAALIPQSKFGLAVRPEVQLGPDPLVLVIKRQAGSPLGPQPQSGAAVALRVPQVQPHFAASIPQRGPDVAFWVAHHEGLPCRARGMGSKEHIGLGGQDHPKQPQDNDPRNFQTPILARQFLQVIKYGGIGIPARGLVLIGGRERRDQARFV